MKFYDDLAEIYHLMYPDWPAAIVRQGRQLHALLEQSRRIADVACGIGTQAIGLAELGHAVVASDTSAGAIARAMREANARKVKIDFRRDDMTKLETYADESVDALISCDNSVPHLLSDDEILTAFKQFHRVVRRGGTVVISVRDYDTIPREPLSMFPFGVRELRDRSVTVFQVWRWDGDQYDLNMYFVGDDGDSLDTQVFRARYYAVSIGKLMSLFSDAGFVDVERFDDKFFQPLIVAKRP